MDYFPMDPPRIILYQIFQPQLRILPALNHLEHKEHLKMLGLHHLENWKKTMSHRWRKKVILRLEMMIPLKALEAKPNFRL